MIKLFAWEPYIQQRISDAREAEVKKLRQSRILGIINTCVSELLPLLSKVIVFAIYVSLPDFSVPPFLSF